MNPIEKLSEKLLKNDSKKATLVFSEINRRYFTKFPATDGILFITSEKAYLLMDFRYAEAAENEARYCEVVLFDSMEEKLSQLIKKQGIKEVCLERECLTILEGDRLKKIINSAGAEAVIDEQLDKAIKSLRMIKTPEEVKKIEESQAITDAAFEHVLPMIKEGVTERELALEIEFFMKREGAECVAFDLIVVAGKNGSLCHGVPSDSKFKKGDLITMDTGARLDGFNSDMTRTVALGQISDEQRKVYDKVLEAHLAVIDAAKPGMVCSDVDKVARDIIEAEYPGTFGHGLGHGVGYDIHEAPRFSKFDKTICEEGMIITDEPGIYLPGKFGVRIEDMLLITADGCKSLTKSPKELIIL